MFRQGCMLVCLLHACMSQGIDMVWPASYEYGQSSMGGGQPSAWAVASL